MGQKSLGVTIGHPASCTLEFFFADWHASCIAGAHLHEIRWLARSAKGRSDSEYQHTMDKDRAFAIYAIVLVTCVFSLLVATVFSGIAGVPTAAFILQDLGLGLAIRTGYKTFDGSNPLVDFLEYTGWKTPELAPADALPNAA